MSNHRQPVTCVCCGKKGRHAGRGLIGSCHSRHTNRGTLRNYPPVRDDDAWKTANRPPRPANHPQPAGDWRSRSACRSVDPEIFWPPANTSLVLERYLAEAGPVCAACPVTTDCLDYALSTGQADGIWGGTTPEQRRSLQFATHPERRAA